MSSRSNGLEGFRIEGRVEIVGDPDLAFVSTELPAPFWLIRTDQFRNRFASACNDDFLAFFHPCDESRELLLCFVDIDLDHARKSSLDRVDGEMSYYAGSTRRSKP